MVTGRLFPICVFLAAILAGCSDTTLEEVDSGNFGYDYYPLEIGRSFIYEVDSVVFREGIGESLRDSSRVLWRELITDTLRDNTGALVYRVERYERPVEEEAPWQIRKVFTRALTATQALRMEDNLRFINLIFPLRTGKTWAGNRFISGPVYFGGGSSEVDIFKGWSRYEAEEVGRPATVGDRRYEEVATIRQADFESAIERRYALEQYARGVGLIYREWRILDSQCRLCCGSIGPECLNLPWEEKAENGFIMRQRLLRYE